jgi:hypothetical protein
MANPRGTVTVGGVVLVAEIGQYRPFGAALGVRVFDGVDSVTIQDWGVRADRQEGTLASGGGTSPGLIASATVAALLALIRDDWGAAHALSDFLGNAGTAKITRFEPTFEYAVPGAQVALHSYTLAWRWLTLDTLYGAAYTGARRGPR